MSEKTHSIIPVEQVENRILLIRGQKVILDSDLARLYGVTTSRLNEQVKRNIDRFPADFMFQLDKNEFDNLKSHFATSSPSWGGRRKIPYAFTEHGTIMAASVLNSPKAVQMSIYVVRAFVKLRQILAPYREIEKRLAQHEKKLQTHDKQIIQVIKAIQLLMPPPQDKPQEPFGFHSKNKSQKQEK